MINFTLEVGKNYINVTSENLPATLIKYSGNSNEEVLKTCQDWLDALGLENVEYHVDIRLH